MANSNEEVVRRAYEFAEGKSTSVPGWRDSFTEDGVFANHATGQSFSGESLGVVVEEMVKGFPDVHREIHSVYSVEDTVIVQLSIQGTHKGTLHSMAGPVEATGRRLDIPCCDVFKVVDGKIDRFDCYPSGTLMLEQLGVVGAAAAR
ncbi:ester cyclase [Streptomyces sp. NPDC026672]|uniref:nuclear transport factor 2 family protein n=1 Tax=unclassified Streptomyces TaxID=2593676 RepID=UPI0033D9688D